MASITVIYFPINGVTGWVTTECSALLSTIKVTDWPATIISTLGSLTPRSREPSLSYTESSPAGLMRLVASVPSWPFCCNYPTFPFKGDIHSSNGQTLYTRCIGGSFYRRGHPRFILVFDDGPGCLVGSRFPATATNKDIFCFMCFSTSLWVSRSQLTKTLLATSKSWVTLIPINPSNFGSFFLMSAEESHKDCIKHALMHSAQD